MQWTLSEEQDAYQRALRDWLDDVAPAATVRAWFEAGDTSAFEERFVADGWAGVGTPEELGGQGGGLVELVLTAEELARSAAPSATWLANVLAAPALAGRDGAAEAAFAGAAVALLVSAEKVPDAAPALALAADGTVSGEAPRVLAGGTAAQFVVPVVDAAGSRSLRLVQASADGVTVTPRDLLDRSRAVADVVLAGAASEALDVDAERVLRDASSRAAVLVAADTLGASERMLALSVEYSKQRHQFGVPIGSFQAVKHASATIFVGVEAARSVVYFAAASVDADGPDSALHAAATKAQVTAEGAKAADSALTLHGAIGYTWEHDLHFFYKRAKLDERLAGSPTVWNERLADALALV
ncbi:MAG: acyl-CoA dehydrogenase [Frankiales bacterium]|nr:acyl-CoA dehydrogenase [Frankiales bacterium]